MPQYSSATRLVNMVRVTFTVRSLAVSLLAVIGLHPCRVSGYVEKPGPKFVATVGHPWPLPKVWTKSDTVYSVDGGEFTFRIVDNTCDILEDALKRYERIVKHSRINRVSRRRNKSRKSETENPPNIEVCEFPQQGLSCYQWTLSERDFSWSSNGHRGHYNLKGHSLGE